MSNIVILRYWKLTLELIFLNEDEHISYIPIQRTSLLSVSFMKSYFSESHIFIT